MASTAKIVGGIAVVAALAYGGYYYANQMANDKMLEKVNAYLVKYDLQDKVTWEKSEASVAGTASFYNVTVVGDSPEETFKVKQINVTKFDESEDSQAVELDFNGLSDSQGKSLLVGDFAGEEGLESLGYDATLPLMNGQVKSDYSKKANNLNYFLKLNQDQVIDVTFDLKALETNALIDAVLNKQDAIEQDPGSALMPAVTPIKLEKLEVTFDDLGVIAKAKAQAGADAAIKLEECQFTLAMVGVSEQAADYCKSLTAFANGEQKKLALKLNPAQAYPVINLMELGQSGMPDVPKLIKDLNLTISN